MFWIFFPLKAEKKYLTRLMQVLSQFPVLFQMKLKCVKKYFVHHTVNLDLRWIQTDVKHVIVNKVIRKHVIINKVIRKHVIVNKVIRKHVIVNKVIRKTCHCKQSN